MDDSSSRIIIFSDLIGSSEVANELSPNNYTADYIKSFYMSYAMAMRFTKAIKDFSWNGKEDEKISARVLGDEVVVMVKVQDISNLPIETATALSFAYSLKLFWLLSEYSRKKILDSHPPREIATGMHFGQVHKVSIKSNVKGVDPGNDFASYDINLAKRIESISRKGNSSNIYVTQRLGDEFKQWRKKQLCEDAKSRKLLACADITTSKPVTLKGIAGNVHVSEFITSITGNKHGNKGMKKVVRAIKGARSNYVSRKTADNFLSTALGDYYPGDWSLNDFFHDDNNLIAYIENLINLALNSGNAWFRFNAYYIASAIMHNMDLEEDESSIRLDLEKLYGRFIALNEGESK